MPLSEHDEAHKEEFDQLTAKLKEWVEAQRQSPGSRRAIPDRDLFTIH